jgi:hypothetical protein
MGKRTRQLGERSLSFVKKTYYKGEKSCINCMKGILQLHRSFGRIQKRRSAFPQGTKCTYFSNTFPTVLYNYSIGLNVHLWQTYCYKDNHTAYRKKYSANPKYFTYKLRILIRLPLISCSTDLYNESIFTKSIRDSCNAVPVICIRP